MGIFDILKKPGDKLEARVTKTERQVIKIQKDDVKLSATRYPNGRIVETRSYDPGSSASSSLLEQFDD